uniref:Uncharacterized protein n=1 Tax=Glossina brevipalpis TaxID=37001 RepID=A0A1A9WQE2_9MUSC
MYMRIDIDADYVLIACRSSKRFVLKKNQYGLQTTACHNGVDIMLDIINKTFDVKGEVRDGHCICIGRRGATACNGGLTEFGWVAPLSVPSITLALVLLLAVTMAAAVAAAASLFVALPLVEFGV